MTELVPCPVCKTPFDPTRRQTCSKECKNTLWRAKGRYVDALLRQGFVTVDDVLRFDQPHMAN